MTWFPRLFSSVIHINKINTFAFQTTYLCMLLGQLIVVHLLVNKTVHLEFEVRQLLSKE